MRGFFVFIMFICFSIQTMYAQSKMYRSDNGFKIAVKNNVLSYAINSINLSLELRVKGQHSVQGVVQLNDKSKRYSNRFLGNGNQIITQGHALGIEYRYYTEKTSPLTGWYVGPYFRYFFRDMEYDPHPDNAPSGPYSNISFKRDVYSYGVIVGFQTITVLGIGGVDLFAGIGARHKSDYDFEYEYELYEIDDFMDGKAEIRLGCNIVLTNP